jgi:uncharacterized protein
MDALLLVALVVMALGLAGTVIPGLPGVLLVFAAAAGYGVLTGFERFSPWWLAPMGVIAGLAFAFDLMATPTLARRFGASKWGVIGALAGLVVGLIVGGPFGALIGPLVGAVALELAFGQTLRQSLRSGLGTAVGFVASMVVDISAALTIIAMFVAVVVF